MSSHLPMLKARQVIQVLEKVGFSLKRQRGSHAFFHHPDGRWTVVSNHSGDIPRGTLKKIISDMQLTENEFRDLL